jgi:hypothetical protein
MSSFERKTLADGSMNPKYIDLCDEDAPIAGQKFACVSFVSPEKILKKRDIFLFEQFLKQWDFTKSVDKFNEFLHFISYKYNLDAQKVISDFADFAKEEDAKLKSSPVDADYKNFIEKQEDKFNELFQRNHAFQTSVRGVKIRGTFASQDEAERHAKKVRESDPNHDIFVGPVGIWMPWDPDAYKTGRVEFMEEELNQLHSEKIKNEAFAKKEFDKRVMDAKKKAIEENIKLAEKSGNVLTQTMDDNGNLVGVRETVNFDDREVASADVREELMKAAIENANKKDDDSSVGTSATTNISV